MEMMPVQSSNVSSIGYQNGCIYVQFHSGAVYQYFASEELFQQFLKAPSKGRFVHQHLKQLPYHRIR